MHGHPFSSRISELSDLSIEDALGLANKRLELACKENDSAKALELYKNVKPLLSNAERILASKKDKDNGPVLHEGIANTYHELGRFLEDLGYGGKAKSSYRKAKKLGYIQKTRQHTGSSRLLSKGDAVRRLLFPRAAPSVAPSIAAALSAASSITAVLSVDPSVAAVMSVDSSVTALSVAPSIAAALSVAPNVASALFVTRPNVAAAIPQDSSKTDATQLNHQYSSPHATPANPNSGKPTSNKDAMQIPEKIFDQNIAPPVARYALPEVNGRFTSTSQLAYCLSLLHPSMVLEDSLDQSERDWLQARVDDPDEQERMQTMATNLVRMFVDVGLKKPNVVAEVVSLVAVLGQDDFRKLLQTFVDGLNQSVLLDVHLLEGLAQMIRNAPQGYIDADDLVKILELLNARIKDTHRQSIRHTYQLALTISQVLDSMVDSQIEGLSREQLHEPLSDYLKGLQQSSDPYLAYQAAYAYQALQYISDDETILQSMMRRTGKIVHGISGVVNAVKALDLIGFIEGLKSIQKGLAGAEKAIGLVKDAYSNTVAVIENGQGLLASLKEGFNFKHKGSWYPALRGLDRLVQEGRFSDFEKLVREAPCQHNPAFRLGACQRLGEIALNTIWSLKTRKYAVEFLRQLHKDEVNKDQQVNVTQWILRVLNQIAKSSKDIIEDSVQEVQINSNSSKGILYHGSRNDNLVLHPIIVTPPPAESPLLDHVQNKLDVETPLRQLRLERLEGRDRDVYISPRAKATPRAKDDFDLTAKVQEFLASDKKVFLVLGDSGAGKSTFNRALEISLWDNYKKINGRIPLFIHLPEIEKPERDLIAERLRKVNFTYSQILELRSHREFILICDGYDESQQTRNLYMSNRLNQPGEWRAQMVISCRTEHIGVEYKDCFQPIIDRNNCGDIGGFQEAIISPFTKEQIRDYVGKYVSLQKSTWESNDYLRALKQIPNLQDLVKSPFLLRLALEVLPRLLKTNTQFSSARITRVQLYDEFVAQWIERGKIRLREMELSLCDRETFRQMTDSGFQQHSVAYLKKLVTAIYRHQNGNPLVHYSVHKDGGTWKEALFSNKDGYHLLRQVIPLTRNGNQYRFIHRSLLEYGLSLTVFGPIKNDVDTEAKPSVSRRGSSSSIFSFENPYSIEGTVAAVDKSLLDSPLWEKSLVGERSVLQFLAERAQQEPMFKDRLHSMIERSKTDKTMQTAAANAITILVRAGVQFIRADLRNVRISGADLSFGMFDSARFEGADLRKVNLRNVWMRQANLKGAQMEEAQFGELPFLKEDSEVVCSAYSPDGKTYAAGLENGNISLYETSSWNRIQRLEGHDDGIGSLSFSVASDRIVSGGEDEIVRLWNVATGECVHTMEGHSGKINSVAYSPKGDQVASGSDDKTVRLWDVDTGKCAHTLLGHNGRVNIVVYSPEGDRVASGSSDCTVRLWDVDTGECIYNLKGHTKYVASVVYSPKGDQIASGSDDKTVRLWNVGTGECVHNLKGHNESISSVAYSPKGDHIVSGSYDYTVRLWNVDTGECVHNFQGHTESVSSVAYSPKSDQIASGSYDSTVRLWDVDTGECIHNLKGHTKHVASVVYSPKGDQIASGGGDRTVRLWDIDISECVDVLHGHSGGVKIVVCSPNGDQIASGSDDSTVRLWDIDTGECIHTLQGHSGSVYDVVYSQKGDRIASGSDDKTVRLWNVTTGECIHTMQDHGGKVNSVAYSPKGNRIASGSDDYTVRLWDVETGKCIHTLQGHSSRVGSVAYSPKGDQIASRSMDKTVRLWDVDTGECIHILQAHNSWVNSVVYSPKGDRIASGSTRNIVQLWDVDTGKCIHTLQGQGDAINNVVYSPKGNQIATGNDKTVRLWDVDTGKCVHALQGHSGRILSVAYSPNGNQIASGSDDGMVRLWDVDTGECIHILQGHSGDVNSVVYSPKGYRIASGNDGSAVEPSNTKVGQYLITGSFDKSVRCWRITEEEVGHRAVLCWSSSHEVLTVHDLSIEDVQGLSRLNRKLLIQRGALVPNPPPCNLGGMGKSNLD